MSALNGGDAANLLEVRGLTKMFGTLKACDHVDLTVRKGEIHALLGENGAGKSTLVKMLFGSLEPNAGEIRWNGQPVRIASPSAARKLGIGMVFQHFSLFEALTAAENIALSLDETRRSHRSRLRLRRCRMLGLPLDPYSLVGDLSVGERQRIEIIRCLLQNPKLIILDEPTSVLTPQEADRLFETLDRLRAEGKSILYISHRLEEVKRMCDAATVLRHGKVVGHCDPRKETPSSLARMMVGSEVGSRAPAGGRASTARGAMLEIRQPVAAAGDAFLDSAAEHQSQACVPAKCMALPAWRATGRASFSMRCRAKRCRQDADTVRIRGKDAGASMSHLRSPADRCRPSCRRSGSAMAAAPRMKLSENLLLSRYATDRKAFRRRGRHGQDRRGREAAQAHHREHGRAQERPRSGGRPRCRAATCRNSSSAANSTASRR